VSAIQVLDIRQLALFPENEPGQALHHRPQNSGGRAHEIARFRLSGGHNEVSEKALSVLDAWQSASFRGYVVVEKRAERRLAVLTLIAQVKKDQLSLAGLLIVADKVAQEQWRNFLMRDGHLPEGWTIQTAGKLIDDATGIKRDCIVIADEIDSYFDEDLVASIKDSRAILGLCASPRGLGGPPHLRKHVGSALSLSPSITELNLHSLSAPSPQTGASDPDDPAEAPEQVLTSGDPQDLLGTYLKSMQKFQLLTAEQEIELAKRIEVGLYAAQKMADLIASGRKLPVQQRRNLQWLCRDAERAKEHFITSNLRLVYQIARKYGRRMEIMDAIQEGNRGLIRAVEKFDYTKGYKFSTYATWWIRQAITRAIPDQTYLIRLPAHLYESDMVTLREWRRRLEAGEDSSAEAIATELQTQPTDVEAAILRGRPLYSLEAMAEAQIDLREQGDYEAIEEISFHLLKDQIQSVLDTLSEREAGVVRLRFGLTDGVERKLDEIGQVYGLTRERIRQIEGKTMSKLRHPTRSDVLKDFLFEESFDAKPYLTLDEPETVEDL
jgi:RNA polymerase sigma factor (sigma-70 family)